MASESITSDVVLRPTRPEDLAAALELLKAANLPVSGVEEWFDRFVVAEHGGAIVGVAGLEVYGTDGLLRSVAVSADWRGRGLGGALTEEILGRSAQEGITALYLLTETAEGFFPRHGFRRIERDDASEGIRASSEFRDLCPASAVVMVRAIDA